MENTIGRLILVFLVMVLVNACSQSSSSVSSELTGDACDIALMSSNASITGTLSETDKSIARYQQILVNSPEAFSKLEQLGWAYVAKARETRDSGYYTLAEQTALCMTFQQPDRVDTLLLHGHVMHNLHRFDEAEKLARRLVEARGLWMDYALLGDVLTERGALAGALDAYQHIVSQRPGPQAYIRISQLRWLKGDVDGAEQMMTQAVQSISPRTPEAAAWARVRLALLLIQTNKLDIADAVLSRALTLQANYAPALHTRGLLMMAQGRMGEAVSVLEQAVRLDPLPEFRWALYEALKATEQSTAASEQLSALQRHGASEDARTFALFLATMGDPSETALNLALQELQLREDVFTLDAVAWALSAAGKPGQAMEFSDRALAEGTQHARLFLHAGVIAAQTGDAGRAIDLLRQAEAIQQMLLPSERQQLINELATLIAQQELVTI